MKNQQQAEEKPFKVGEPSADNAGGNPEPSTSKYEEACVETRRKVCIKCGGEIPSTKYSNSKFCSERCRQAHASWKHAVKTGKIKVSGVGSGGNQWDEKNHQFTTGHTTYRRKGRAIQQHCNRCGTTEKLLVHHKDHDRTNNHINNLEVLCKRCHQQHHAVRDEYGRYTKG